jgi:hypothetical protein
MPLGVGQRATTADLAMLRDHPIVGTTLRPKMVYGSPGAPRLVAAVSAPGNQRYSVNGMRLTYRAGSVTRSKTLNLGLVVVTGMQPLATCGPDTVYGSPTPGT